MRTFPGRTPLWPTTTTSDRVLRSAPTQTVRVVLPVPRHDQFGQVIDVLTSEKRDLAATRRFFTRALERASQPTEVSTNRASAYPRVLDELLPTAWHVMEQYANNLVESVLHEVARNERITRTGGRYGSAA